jgi:hypothetical protein
MLGFYTRWIDEWERRLASGDKKRIVRPFAWGREWLGEDCGNGGPAEALARHAAEAVAHSERFFSYQKPSTCGLSGSHLTFPSPLSSPYPENNIVHAEFFPAAGDRNRAVLVLPQWNAGAEGHVGLCRLRNRFGITALRMSMPYHDLRMPPELARADYHLSSNVGRTIHALRQSVIDSRACLDWLEGKGYRRLGILGTSLGSCAAFITAAHDTRLRVGVFNHVSMYFSDVVWTGLSTRHVREGLEGHVTQDELRAYWSVISPATYFERLQGRDLRSLLLWARYDTTFLPVYSRQVVDSFRRLGLPHEVVVLPCAHYTTGRFPFMLMDGLAICRFIRGNL